MGSGPETQHPWFTAPDRRAIVGDETGTLPPLQKHSDKNTTCKLPLLSQVPKSWVCETWTQKNDFCLLSTNVRLIQAGRLMFGNYVRLENEVMWHTCAPSLLPHRYLKRKACHVRSLPLAQCPCQEEMCLLLCTDTSEVIIASKPALALMPMTTGRYESWYSYMNVL